MLFPALGGGLSRQDAEAPGTQLFLRIHHDEDADVYFNGVLAAKIGGFTGTYLQASVSSAARAALRHDGNVIAVHCHQTTGGQYIDVGIEELVPARK